MDTKKSFNARLMDYTVRGKTGALHARASEVVGGMVRSSRYCAWAVLDVEDWSSRPAVNAARIQNALKRIEDQALARSGIEPECVGRQRRGDGAILALPGTIPKELITTRFVESLREAVADHDADCAPGESIRIRLSLHAGEALEGEGEWAGQPVIIACRLVDSSVIKRVLAASTGNPLALIVSRDWYDAVIREGYASSEGYREVWVEAKTFVDSAWVKVPGRTTPPGLLPEDDPARDRGEGAGSGAYRAGPQSVRAGGYTDNSTYNGNTVRNSTIQGDVVFGDKYGSDNRRPGGGR